MSTHIKTKEEILNQVANNHSYQDWGEAMYDTHEHTQIEFASEAMDEYAKQQVVEFDEWKQKNKYQKSENGWYSNQPPIAGKQTWFLTEELYFIFLKETSK